jgi:hypothetical protein
MRRQPPLIVWQQSTAFIRRYRAHRRLIQRPGLVLNIAIRLNIAYFLGETLLRPDDPRFAGKAIPVRNLIIVGSLSLLIPMLYLWRRRWERYPFWLDNLYLSIFWLDMAGNSFDLYDRYYHFDLIPHCHGTGASAVVLREAFGLSHLSAVGAANIIHTLLEAQEYYTDVVFGTHNVRGIADTINDLVVGILGTGLYMLAYIGFKKKRKTAGARHAAPLSLIRPRG